MDALMPLRRGRKAVAIETVDRAGLATCRKRLGARAARWLQATGFTGAAGQVALLPAADGSLQRVLAGVDRSEPLWALGQLASTLPPGTYALAAEGVLADARLAALSFALGAYRYTRYKAARRAPARLAVDTALHAELAPRLEATTRVRDLVNTPTEDLGPEQLAEAVREIAQAHAATVREWVGEALIEANFPAIHAVGRASHRAPRLIELNWGSREHPRLALVGKGVCFDTGGLDLKTGDGMRWMKKDMGGAAHALALAGWVMRARLPVRLTLLIPAVENAIAANAYRPGEVIRTRSGLSVEIDNTDAEGRVILGDALAYAGEQQPDLIIDFATLTGAARVALGPDLPALFANRDELAAAALAAAQAEHDPLWRLPLWRPYRRLLDSHVADFANSGASRHAGAITAALYLERFVPAQTPWLHLDTYAWNDGDRPGRPKGGEALGLRAMFGLLARRYRG